MLYHLYRLFTYDQAKDLRSKLIMSNEWVEGSSSARGKAKEIKRNLQLNPGILYKEISDLIIKKIIDDPYVNATVFPSKVFNLLFTRTGVGMYYGPHVDSPTLANGRRDLSFTIFLNGPEEYQGGDLILEIPPERKQIKLKAGEMVIYPTRYLHEVKEVSKGERMVSVGWIESHIPRDDDRFALSTLKIAMTDVITMYGQSKATNHLNLVYNLIYKRFLT